jgi:hypothetical protein
MKMGKNTSKCCHFFDTYFPKKFTLAIKSLTLPSLVTLATALLIRLVMLLLSYAS